MQNTTWRASGSACHPILNEAGHGAFSRDGLASVRLTPLQFALLSYLAYLPPLTVGRYSDIAAAMCPHDYLPMEPRLIRWHAGIVRRLVTTTALYVPSSSSIVPWPASILITEWGVGLRLNWSLGLVPPHPTQSKRTRKSIK